MLQVPKSCVLAELIFMAERNFFLSLHHAYKGEYSTQQIGGNQKHLTIIKNTHKKSLETAVSSYF